MFFVVIPIVVKIDHRVIACVLERFGVELALAAFSTEYKLVLRRIRVVRKLIFHRLRSPKRLDPAHIL